VVFFSFLLLVIITSRTLTYLIRPLEAARLDRGQVSSRSNFHCNFLVFFKKINLITNEGEERMQCCGLADPGSGILCIFEPGICDGKKSRAGIRDKHSGSYFEYQFFQFGLKILKLFDANPDPVSCRSWIRNPGWKKTDPGSRINIPDSQHWRNKYIFFMLYVFPFTFHLQPFIFHLNDFPPFFVRPSPFKKYQVSFLYASTLTFHLVFIFHL
jgi:hypothetical protein